MAAWKLKRIGDWRKKHTSNRRIRKLILKPFQKKRMKKANPRRALDNVKMKVVSFNKETEKDMLDFLSKKDMPFQEYVKELIKKDMSQSMT